MPNYKDSNSNVHFIDNESFAHLLPPGCIRITDEEAYAIQSPAKTDDQIIEQKKAHRHADVCAIKVTTHTGNVFDGDEISQGRMARAIIGMQTQPGILINWVLANNIPTPVNAAELTEALALAGMAQAAIWSAPYA